MEVRMDRLKSGRDKFYGAIGLAEGFHIQKNDLPKNATKTPSIKPADIPLRGPFDPLRAKLFGYWREAAEREIDRPSAKLKGQAEPKDKVGSNPTTGLQKTRLRTILAGELSRLGRRPDDDDYRRTVAAARQAWLQSWLDLVAEKLENRSPVAESAFQFKVQTVLHALADLHEVQLRMGDNEGAAMTLRLLGKAIEILPAQSALRLTPSMRPSWIAFVGARWARMGDRELGEAWLRSAHFAVIPSVGNSDYSKQTNSLTALFAAEAGNLKRCKEEAEFLKNVPRRLSESATGYAAFAHGRLALASLKAGDQREAMAAIRFALSLESEYGVTTTDLLPAIEALALMDNGLEAMKPLRKAWHQFGLRGEELSRIAATLAEQGHLKLVDEIQKRAAADENQERVYHALAKRQALATTDLQKVYRDIQDLPTSSQRAASYLGVMSALLRDIQAKGP
jgi:hypothetical protein